MYSQNFLRIPYSCQSINSDDIAAVIKVLTSDFITQGPAVEKFELQFSKLHHVKHCVSMSNATAALHVGCLALGLKPNDLVWTSPISFVASANCALYCGARIDFVDIDPKSKSMSIHSLKEKLRLAKEANDLPKIVIPVDFAGMPADLMEIRELADVYGFRILEDASHAVGAVYKGKPVSSCWADATVFSFHAVKIITTAEGGILATNNDEVAHNARLLRSHGITKDSSKMETIMNPQGWYYEQQTLGFNYRLTDLQASLGTSQLSRLESMSNKRSSIARRYDDMLAKLPLNVLPNYPDRVSANHLYVIQLSDSDDINKRKSLYDHMQKFGIGVNVHYIPIHIQPYYTKKFGFKRGMFKNAEEYYDNALTIPLYPELTVEQQDYIVNRLEEFFH